MWHGSIAHRAFELMCGSSSATDNSHYQYVNEWVSDAAMFETSHYNRLCNIFGLDKEDMKSYRPVSNLPFISKLIQKVAAQRWKNTITSITLFTLIIVKAIRQKLFPRKYTVTLLRPLTKDPLRHQFDLDSSVCIEERLVKLLNVIIQSFIVMPMINNDKQVYMT